LKGYDEPEILRSQLSRFGPISADAGQSATSGVSWVSFPASGLRPLLKKSKPPLLSLLPHTPPLSVALLILSTFEGFEGYGVRLGVRGASYNQQ
jgi:hypothetical protein